MALASTVPMGQLAVDRATNWSVTNLQEKNLSSVDRFLQETP